MKDPICERCAKPRSKHALANFPDGPMIGGPTLVCPTAALFLEHVEPVHTHRVYAPTVHDPRVGRYFQGCDCRMWRESVDGETWTEWSKP